MNHTPCTPPFIDTVRRNKVAVVVPEKALCGINHERSKDLPEAGFARVGRGFRRFAAPGDPGTASHTGVQKSCAPLPARIRSYADWRQEPGARGRPRPLNQRRVL